MVGDPTAHLATPLHGFRHVETTTLTALEAAVRRYYPEAKFEISNSVKRLNAVANRCQLGDIALTYGRHGTRLRIEIPNLNNYALLFSFRGGARAQVRRGEVEINGNRALLASVSQSVILDYSAEFEQLVLNISPIALERKLEALTGEAVKERPIFGLHVNFRRPEAENVRKLFMFLVERLDSDTSSVHPVALAEFEQALVVSLLTANDNNYSLLLRHLPRSAAAWQVRRAEAYIEANWDQPLTIEALVLVTGVSARTLFHSFRKNRGYSPMDFVKRVRLDHARRMLQADVSTSVTTVAFACGFGNLGHFSGYYRRAFGEMPSATLRNGLRA